MKSLAIYVLVMNVLAYLAMWFDKYQSKKKGFRIPESRLFLLAVMFGAVGIFLGMKAPIYHKAAKPKFKIGIPILIVVNAVCLYLMYRYQ